MIKKITKILLILLLAIGLALFAVAFFFGHRDIPAQELTDKYANVPSSFARVGGMPVHYRDEGNPADSIPLVLLHGTGSSLHTFDPWVESLKKDRRVIRMDLPGFGLTGPFPDSNYSTDHYVEFLEEFLTHMKVRTCILGGNSLGGQIAWRFAAAHPKRVEKLILIDAAGYPRNIKSEPIAFKIAGIPILNRILTYITPRSLVRSSVENVYADKAKVDDPLVDRYYELSLREGNRQALVDRIKSFKDPEPIELIKDIKQPTLVLWGAEDLLIPVETARRFHEDLPNDTLVILAGTGHVPMEESPGESLAPLLHFLEQP